jgi:PAS domain S-box-containing protein
VVVGLLALEVLVGQASVALSPSGSMVAAFWPNAGLSVIALCVALPRWRPWVVAGVFVVTVPANLLGGRALDVSLGYALANALEAATVIWWLTRHGRPHPSAASLRDFVRLMVAALLGATVAALIASATLLLLGEDHLFVTGRGVLAAHVAAILILAPLGMALPVHQGRRAGTGESALQWGSLAVVTLLVFGPHLDAPLTFLPFPLLAWGALRLQPRVVSVQLALYGVLVSVLTSAGRGPLSAEALSGSHPPETVGALLQAHLLCAALVALPLSVVRTQQLSTSDELEHSHALLTNILASTTGNAILGTDLRGCIEFFNVGAEQLTGYHADEVTSGATAVLESTGVRRQLAIRLGGDPDPEALEPLVSRLRDGVEGNVTEDWELLRRDGETRTVSLTLTLRLGEDGRVVGYLATGEDVTQRRREEALVEAALQTEKQIVERLAQVDQTKNDFMASVSHELRTPITSIVGYAELLLSDDTGTLPTMHHQIVGRIERNGRRLMGLIEDMLTMSQVEVGNFSFERVPLDLRDPVHVAVEGIQPWLAIHELQLEEELGDAPVKVLGDPDKLERVVTNLLTNAAKFSHGGDRIWVRLTLDDDHAVITVTDSGVGISPEDQVHLFDRFFRGADAYARAIQGVGLGLPIASSIVAGHDGRIDVVSELDVGSSFIVRLPLLGEGEG